MSSTVISITDASPPIEGNWEGAFVGFVAIVLLLVVIYYCTGSLKTYAERSEYTPIYDLEYEGVDK